MTQVLQAFRLEKEMVEPVRSSICSLLGLDFGRTTILTTPSIGNVIPDLLLASWQTGSACSRATITHTEAALLAPLEAFGSLTEAEIRKRITISELGAKRHFHRLQRIGAIKRLDSGALKISDIMRTDSFEIIAVELKMSRWKEALDQAVSYQAFADQAYVVLDAGQVSLNEKIFIEFEQANVGLLLQDHTRLIRVLRCRSRVRFSPDRLIASQKLKKLGGFDQATDSNRRATSRKLRAIPADAVCPSY